MAKRNESILELLAVLPWWVCVGFSGLSFLILRYYIPSMHVQQNGPADINYMMFKGFAGAAPFFAPVVALLLLIPALISFLKGIKEHKGRAVQIPRSPSRAFGSPRPSRSIPVSRPEPRTPSQYPGIVSTSGAEYHEPAVRAAEVHEVKRDDVSIEADTLSSMEWFSFELFCKLFYEGFGYKVTKTKAGADGGIDLLLFENGSESPHALVQCKARTSREVGVSFVRELLGVMTAKKVGKGILVTNSSFSVEAVDFARGQEIELLDVHDLEYQIEKLDDEKKRRLSDFLESTDFRTPTCPRCEKKMVERVANKGRNAGQAFWGCQNYPKCRYTMNEGRV